MTNLQVNTTQNIALNLELGTLGDRILARLLDAAIILGYIILAFVISSLFVNISHSLTLVIILILPVVFYDLISETTLNGQSIGKRALKIKVVSLDGNQPTMGQYLIRWLFRLVDFTLSQSICAVVCVAVSQKHQRLGDMVAGTAVVKTDPPTILNETLYVPVSDDYEVRFPEATNLKETDIQLIKEVLSYHDHQHNLLLVHNTADKIKDLLHIQSNMDPGTFLHIIIADYNYLQSRI